MADEAVAHMRVQAWFDETYAKGDLPDPTSLEFNRDLYRRFYEAMPELYACSQRIAAVSRVVDNNLTKPPDDL